MDVAILDLGIGNLHSLAKALQREGASVRVESEPLAALDAQALVLPGVGAFGAAARRLAPAREAVRARLLGGLACLGICLGMQLLFESSEEGEGDGLAVLAGRVERLAARPLPHVGWNDVVAARPDPLLAGVDPLLAYFAHTFAAVPACAGDALAWSRHGESRFVAAVRRGRPGGERIWGVQFHPEKSGDAGLRLLRNFLEASA